MGFKVWNIEKFKETARRAAAEGIVMLKNDNNALPIADKSSIAVFGRSQMNYYKSGTGSGGMVNVDYVVGIYEALLDSKKYKLNKKVREAYEKFVEENPFDVGEGWASEPWFQKEMPLTDKLVKDAAKESDTAIFIVGRTAGEDQDSKNEPGSILLTDTERDAIKKLTGAFKKTVVLLNVGNIIDMRWVKELDPSAVLYVWQGGQEGGNAVLDVLSGKVNPSGRLSDTIAEKIEDYPSTENFGSDKENLQCEDIYVGYRYFETFAKDKVLYPFGFGLSYTDFDISCNSASYDNKSGIKLEIEVENTGSVAGKEVAQVYVQAPQGKLGKPLRVLAGFAKTDILKAGEKQVIDFDIPKYWFSSYDDSGLAGHKSSYVLEKGEYKVFAGANVREAKEVFSFEVAKTEVIAKCEEALAPVRKFKRIRPEEACGLFATTYEDVPVRTLDPNKKRDKNLPKALAYTGDKGYKLKDVADKKVSMDKFLAQISDADLCAMMRGEGMCSPKVTPGVAGAFGGVTDNLVKLGIPVAGCSDGPSGIRMDCGTHAFSLPNGTCLACTFDESINEELFTWEALDLRKNRIDALLGPGMNIHRSPLNGRNFEYFSEDPILTGKMVSAQLRGMHKYDVTGVIKHFAGNTQEFNRHHVNSVASERALREIYLKGFEIAVKEGNARAIMSTYGPVNGIYTSSSYDLLTTILRGEWGFDGIVMTDWWAMGNDFADQKGSYHNVAAQVRAQNDLNMVNASAADNSNNDNLDSQLKLKNLTRGELVRSADNICRFLLKAPVYKHMLGEESELDKELKEAISSEDADLLDLNELVVEKDVTEIDPSLLSCEKGKSTNFVLTTPKRCQLKLEMVVKTEGQPKMAQVPMSIFQDNNLIRTVTLTGMDTEYQTIEVELNPSFSFNFYVKFYFGQAGMVFKSIKLIKTKDLEKMFARE